MIPTINDLTLRTLEFDTVLAKVAEFAVSSAGKERIESLEPFSNTGPLQDELNRITEMKDILEYGDPFPLTGFSDIRPDLKRAEAAGAYLQPEAFLAIKHVLTLSGQMVRYFIGQPDRYPLLQKINKKIVPAPELEKEISRVIDPAGQIHDRASDALFKIRRELQRKTGQVRNRLESILHSMVSSGYAQEDALVLRRGRLVIPMKESHRGRLKSVIVDESASGATVFVEPIEILEMNNAIYRLHVQEEQEIEKILQLLTDTVRENRLILADNFDTLAEIDSYMARARFSMEEKGQAAAAADECILELNEARHPLLLMRESMEKVIPLSLRMGGNLKTLVITGPNAGGKTVALKTAGLLALMHQFGLHVPVKKETVIPLFSHIFTDIGDQQSIEQDLSTFSSHIRSIRSILEKADERSLVLIDEIGSSTDPSEGAALAETILRHLTRKGCTTLATTHMGALKIFAHEEVGVENGSMVFDQKTLQPTYRFQMGIPGASYAFEIAERLGVSQTIVKEARDLVGEERGKLDRLILHLEEELQKTHRLLEDAEIKESELSGLVKLYREELNTLRKESGHEKRKIVKEAETILKEAKSRVEHVVREIREKQASRESIREAKQALTSLEEKIVSLTEPSENQEIHSFHKGDWAVWEGHKGKGQIVSRKDKSGRVLVDWDGVRLRIPVADLQPAKTSSVKPSLPATPIYAIEKRVGDEIDLRGMTADEAIESVEKYIGDAVMSGFSTVRIIHGKGTGVLRREIGRYLKGHARVKSQRLGSWNEGDTGVTVVELR
jgi:DNA mismatch repair protein MutS2